MMIFNHLVEDLYDSRTCKYQAAIDNKASDDTVVLRSSNCSIDYLLVSKTFCTALGYLFKNKAPKYNISSGFTAIPSYYRFTELSKNLELMKNFCSKKDYEVVTFFQRGCENRYSFSTGRQDSGTNNELVYASIEHYTDSCSKSSIVLTEYRLESLVYFINYQDGNGGPVDRGGPIDYGMDDRILTIRSFFDQCLQKYIPGARIPTYTGIDDIGYNDQHIIRFKPIENLTDLFLQDYMSLLEEEQEEQEEEEQEEEEN